MTYLIRESVVALLLTMFSQQLLNAKDFGDDVPLAWKDFPGEIRFSTIDKPRMSIRGAVESFTVCDSLKFAKNTRELSRGTIEADGFRAIFADLTQGRKIPLFGQVYEWQVLPIRAGLHEGRLVRHKVHRANLALGDKNDVFSLESGIHFYSGLQLGRRKKDAFPRIHYTLSRGCADRLLSPASDADQPYTFVVGVGDVIETDFLKLKVHNIVEPDEEDGIRGWINFKLIEAKPLTK